MSEMAFVQEPALTCPCSESTLELAPSLAASVRVRSDGNSETIRLTPMLLMLPLQLPTLLEYWPCVLPAEGLLSFFNVLSLGVRPVRCFSFRSQVWFVG